MVSHYKSCLGDKELGVGQWTFRHRMLKLGQLVADRIRAHNWLEPEQTIITSTCGFNHLPRHIALGKLRAMREAQAILRGNDKA